MDANGALAAVNRIYPRLNSRRPEIDKFESYYQGNQKLTFATEEWMKKNAARYDSFSDNWCAPVSNAISERIQHTGLKLRDATGKDATDPFKGIWESWLRNEMEMQSSQGFLTSFNARRSYVIVWGDEHGEPVNSWEHPSNVEIDYDPDGLRRRRAALKTWMDEEFEYATLFTPEEVWKWKRKRVRRTQEEEAQSAQLRSGMEFNGGWEPRLPRETLDDTWPLVNPLGVVPVVEIPNRPLLRGEPVSEIQQVIPMQDAINILWAYLMYAADMASMPARVLLGTAPPMRKIVDSNGNKIGEQPITMEALNEARFAVFNSADAKIDSWPAAQLDVFTDVIEIAVGHIAAQTRTPPHYLVSNKGLSNLAADALKAAEIGLVKKAREFQMFANPAIREIHRLNALVKGDVALAREIQLATVLWANPEMRSEAQVSDALVKKKNIGYPFEYLLELDGVEPSDHSRIMDMRRAEQQAAMEQAMQGVADGAGYFGGDSNGEQIPDAALDGAAAE